MRKPDEIQFYVALLALHGGPYKSQQRGLPFADKVGADLGMHEKRVYGLLNKWTDRGWWEFGVTMRSGWFTPEAPAELKA